MHGVALDECCIMNRHFTAETHTNDYNSSTKEELNWSQISFLHTEKALKIIWSPSRGSIKCSRSPHRLHGFLSLWMVCEEGIRSFIYKSKKAIEANVEASRTPVNIWGGHRHCLQRHTHVGSCFAMIFSQVLGHCDLWSMGVSEQENVKLGKVLLLVHIHSLGWKFWALRFIVRPGNTCPSNSMRLFWVWAKELQTGWGLACQGCS